MKIYPNHSRGRNFAIIIVVGAVVVVVVGDKTKKQTSFKQRLKNISREAPRKQGRQQTRRREGNTNKGNQRQVRRTDRQAGGRAARHLSQSAAGFLLRRRDCRRAKQSKRESE